MNPIKVWWKVRKAKKTYRKVVKKMAEKPQYSVTTGSSKMLKEGLWGAIAVMLTAPIMQWLSSTAPDIVTPELQGSVTVAVAGILIGLSKFVRNLIKTKSSSETTMATVSKALTILLCAGIALGGCVTSRFSETVTSPLENGQVETSDTSYLGLSTAWPFSKIDTTNHKFDYRFGGPKSTQDEITVGQEAQGIDNSGMNALLPLIEVLVKALASGGAGAAVPTP